MDPKKCKQVVYIGWQFKNTAQVCPNSVAVGCALRISVTRKYKCWTLPVVFILLNIEEWRWCCGLKRGCHSLGWCCLPDPICGIFLSVRRRWQCQSRTSPCWVSHGALMAEQKHLPAIQVFPGTAYHLHCCAAAALMQLWALRFLPSGHPLSQLYPAFGWNRVNFLPSSWYSSVFWIQYENNFDSNN